MLLAGSFVRESRAVVEQMIEEGKDAAPMGRMTVVLRDEDEDPPTGAIALVPLVGQMRDATRGQIAYVLGRSMDDA